MPAAHLPRVPAPGLDLRVLGADVTMLEVKDLRLGPSLPLKHVHIYYASGGREDVVEHVEAWLREGRSVHVSAMAWAARRHRLARHMLQTRSGLW